MTARQLDAIRTLAVQLLIAQATKKALERAADM
jgi:hypothetical protein